MPYAGGRTIHDADAHIMETPTWLRDHADPDVRDRIAPLDLSSGNELRQTGDPDEQLKDLVAAFDRLAAKHASDEYRADEAAEIMSRKNFAATGSFVAEDRPRALDLLGFQSQLVFNTFHNRRLRDWEHGGDGELAVRRRPGPTTGAWSSSAPVDDRLLPTCYVPLFDIDARARPGRRGAGPGRGGAADRLGLPARATPRATSVSTRCGRRPRRPASRSCSTSAARAT